jgi:hypothetical protein
MTGLKRRLRIALIIAGVLVLAAAVAGFNVLRAVYISKVGITIKPSRDYEVREVTYYLQNDPVWSKDTIGETSQTLGGVGCLISCAASAMTELGIDITPAELNEKLSEVGGFSGASLIWYKIHEAIPEVDYTYSRVFSAKTIENDLSEGRLPIVNVRYFGGATHWVLIIGAKDGEFMIYDPLNREKTPVPLSTHGKVYSYRVLVKA